MRIWLDVGAHYGETTLPHMADDLTIYAFEPNLTLALKSAGKHPRFVVLPMAVAESNGCVPFYVTANDSCSSILPLDAVGVDWWKDNTGLEVTEVQYVPAIRLDAFLDRAGIAHVEYLKVDAQGADLAVVRSLGQRIKDVDRIRLEVQIVRSPYMGASDKTETVAYLESHGFRLVGAQPWSHNQEENLDFERVA
jgi:FkbM family methyltransferase